MWTKVIKSASGVDAENVKLLTHFPIHPGAMRYYKGKGIL